MNLKFRKSWVGWLVVIGLILLMILPRLTALNQYLIVDEPDRWRWAKDFALALNQGDLAATLVGDGYPGIVPVWLETLWILIEAGRRSLLEGQWIGEIGLAHLLHEWDRTELLFQQRLPIVLFNIVIGLAIIWAIWRLFGSRVALVSGLLIALDPFYLSDSRVNRAEAVITGLMTLSMLSLIFYYQKRQTRYVIISGIFGGLSFLTKIQALAILPVVALTGAFICFNPIVGGATLKTDRQEDSPATIVGTTFQYLLPLLKFGSIWALAACLTWFLLWPAMWVTPLETLTLVYNYATRKVGAEGVNLFFLGQTYQDADPGLLFYLIVFLLRVTPLVLVGLFSAAYRLLVPILRRRSAPETNTRLAADPFAVGGSAILIIYVLLYTAIMTVGSHKQDRYLMPVFLGLDILAAMGLVYLWGRLKHRFLAALHSRTLKIIEVGLLAGLVIIQTATVLPHHPYYYTYFNPIFGGGQTAAHTLRIGWGEGMDQVGAYLAAKPDSQNLVVGTRFRPNMLGFKGEVVTLGEGGYWTGADYVVLYVQQIQRRMDPSPAFIDYFQARTPEKIITLGGIDYAWIYPIPFTNPANPLVSQLPDQVALLGYSWQTNQPPDEPATQPSIRLVWKNLGLSDHRQLVARLVGPQAKTEWVSCSLDPAFIDRAGIVGAYIESLCGSSVTSLPPAFYTVEFGLTSANGEVEPIRFPEGRQAARVTQSGELLDTSEFERFEAIANQTIPPEAHLLNRIYDGRIRLLAYLVDPTGPSPNETLELTLYWQPIKRIVEPIYLTVQLADSRSLPLGRVDRLLTPSTRAADEGGWPPGEVTVTRHKFSLAPELDAPLAGRIEIGLKDESETFLQPTTASGEKLGQEMARFTIRPDTEPIMENVMPIEAVWQTPEAGGDISLRGYAISPKPPKPGQSIQVTLFWETNRPITEEYLVFVHVLDEAGQIKTQNDSIPRAGAYPTSWWLPDMVIEDTHPLDLPADLFGGTYQIVVGLYRAEDGTRLLRTGGSDSLNLIQIEMP